jgi:cytoskeletal protein CcmA (bactofilin family)
MPLFSSEDNKAVKTNKSMSIATIIGSGTDMEGNINSNEVIKIERREIYLCSEQ